MSFPPRPVPTVSVQEAAKRLEADGPARPLVVDVRDTHEFARVRAEGAVLLPLGTFVRRFRELPVDRPLLLICASGNRSATATAFLLARSSNARSRSGEHEAVPSRAWTETVLSAGE